MSPSDAIFELKMHSAVHNNAPCALHPPALAEVALSPSVASAVPGAANVPATDERWMIRPALLAVDGSQLTANGCRSTHLTPSRIFVRGNSFWKS